MPLTEHVLKHMEQFVEKLPRPGHVLYIETGTHIGDGLETAISRLTSGVTHFHSVELTEPQYHHCVGRFATNKKVSIHHDSSDVFLKRTLPKLLEISDYESSNNSSALVIWLDAHWSGGDIGDPNRECPLVEELRALRPVWGERPIFLAIDDWRSFHGSLSSESDPSQWPTAAQVEAEIPQENVVATEYRHEKIFVSIPGDSK